MGCSKADLPFGPETMLQRVVRLLGEVVGPVVVVAAEAQQLPELPSTIVVVRDRRPDRGPLEGIVTGLSAMPDRCDAAYVTACDVPLLLAGFVRRVIELSADFDVAVPNLNGHDQPLAAVYKVGVVPRAEAILAEGNRRPADLFDRVRTRRIGPDELTDVDPDLQSLANVNSPDDYQAALARAGFEPQE